MLISQNVISSTRKNNHSRIGPLIALGLMHGHPWLRHIFSPLHLLLVRQRLHQPLFTHLSSLLARSLARPKCDHFPLSGFCLIFCDIYSNYTQANGLNEVATSDHCFLIPFFFGRGFSRPLITVRKDF